MAQTAQPRRIEVAQNDAQRVFNLQREAYLRHPYRSLQERRQDLDRLERILLQNADAIADAINADFGHRAAEESKILELFTGMDGIRHTRRKLRKWMRPRRRRVSVLFATGSHRVIPQSKGVVGVVSPWNYPLFLTVSPLTSVLAAGNRAAGETYENVEVMELLDEQERPTGIRIPFDSTSARAPPLPL